MAMSLSVIVILILALATIAESGVVIRPGKVKTPSTEAAKAIDEYRDSAKKLQDTLSFAKNTVESAPGSRHVQLQKVLKAQGEAVVAASAAEKKAEAQMEDVKVSGNLKEKAQPKVTDDLQSQADDLATHMGSEALGCECAAQLYGDKRVTLLQKPHTHKNKKHCNCKRS